MIAAAAMAGIAGLAVHAARSRQNAGRALEKNNSVARTPMPMHKEETIDMTKGLKPDQDLDRITKVKAWVGTAALTAACAFGVHAMAPDYKPGRGLFISQPEPVAAIQPKRPEMLKQGLEIMIVASLDEGEIGGAQPILSEDGHPTGQTRWVRPEPMSINLRRFVDGEVSGESDDPGVDFDLQIPRSCAKAARTMIGHGVKVPTTWWRVPSNDPQAIVDAMQTTHKRDGLVAVVCEDGPIAEIDKAGGIPVPETAPADDGPAKATETDDGKSAS
jgi:hypothetical protein